MKSAIYQGQVRHRRFAPRDHEFSYRLFLMYLDLSELDRVFEKRWFWSSKGPAPARFRREDHFGDPAVPLEQSVRDLVERSGGRRPSGPVRLLTHLSYFGYCFNPVSFYYCYDRLGEQVETIVAEVNNTPWGEQHCYVLTGARQRPGGHLRYRPVKRMHVSPFMPMDVGYDWQFRQPGRRLAVHMALEDEGRKVFDATLDLHREEITTTALARVLVRFPLMTARVMTAIHWQALKLWLKGCPVHDHPDKKTTTLTEH